jgi:ABC-type protease/lipase transport system fused ATPase/permease subunit
MEEGEDAEEEEEEKSGAEAHVLEKLQVLRGFIDGEDGSVVVDLPNLGAQHVFILIELCFHCWGIFGLKKFTATFNPVFIFSYLLFEVLFLLVFIKN